jgi:hypothetical protein
MVAGLSCSKFDRDKNGKRGHFEELIAAWVVRRMSDHLRRCSSVYGALTQIQMGVYNR